MFGCVCIYFVLVCENGVGMPRGSANLLGAAVLTASEDGAAKYWNARSGECRKTFEGHGDGVFSAVL